MKHIEHDCDLIMEAIRRLHEGTWELQDEDQTYSWELFPKIKASLLEHVAFEEERLFPLLPPAEREHHADGHRHLLTQLWSVEEALERMEASRFHDLLLGLRRMLEEHHQEFAAYEKGGEKISFCAPCQAEERILSRNQSSVL